MVSSSQEEPLLGKSCNLTVHYIANVFHSQSTWALGRNTTIYGSDAALFRPSRWIEASSKQLAIMEKQADLTFGHGRFSCLGRPVAQMELNKVFVEILRNFDLEIVNPDKPWDCEGRGVFLMKNFWVRVTERDDGTGR
jgi:cytochrome P450